MHLNNIYTELYEISRSDNIRITLCLSAIDHLLYIKKELEVSNEKVYEKLKIERISGIPEIYHLYHIENTLVIIEEYFNMNTLENYRFNHFLTRNEIRRIMKQLCRIVKSLHSFSIIHRDLKLDNIFYDGKRVILFDFDISHFEDEQINFEQVNGSYGYICPESYFDLTVRKKNDIYALGIIYYQLLYHDFPACFKINSFDDWIILKMIQKDPKKRTKTIDMVNIWISLLVHFPFLK